MIDVGINSVDDSSDKRGNYFFPVLFLLSLIHLLLVLLLRLLILLFLLLPSLCMLVSP